MYPVNKYLKVSNDTSRDIFLHKKIYIVRNRIYYKIRYNIHTNF